MERVAGKQWLQREVEDKRRKDKQRKEKRRKEEEQWRKEERQPEEALKLMTWLDRERERDREQEQEQEQAREQEQAQAREQLLTEDVMDGLALERVAGEQRLQARAEDERRQELELRRLAPREEELELQPLIEGMEADIREVASIESGVVNEYTEELSSLERVAEERQQALAGEMLLWGQEQDPAGEELRREPEPEELGSFTPAPAARLVDRERRKVHYLEWIFVIANFILELPSAVFDQLSSVRKPQFALLSMLMLFATLFICIIELLYKCRKEKVTWKWRGRLPWLYPVRSHKPFGSFKDIIGLVCAIFQCVVTIINYNFRLRHADIPIKISVWPIVFAFGLLCSKFLGDRERVPTNLLPLSRDDTHDH